METVFVLHCAFFSASPPCVVLGCLRTFLLRMAETKDDVRTFLKVDFLKDFMTDMTTVLGSFACIRCDVTAGDGERVQGCPRLLHLRHTQECHQLLETVGVPLANGAR